MTSTGRTLEPRAGILLALLLLASVGSGEAVAARTLPTGFSDQLVTGNLSFPVGMAFLPDGRLFVVERPGRVRLIVEGKLGAVDPVASPDSVSTTFYESGLLGIAVDAQWPLRPYVYVYYTSIDSTIRITRYRAVGDLSNGSSVNLSLDPASRYVVLRDIPDRAERHNGGTLRFGPDGMLYAAPGDDSEPCAAQDTVSLRGVVLRLKVDGLPDGPGGPPNKAVLVAPGNPFASHPNLNARLVWAMGLRNPFRFQIDPRNGALFVADVGAALNEEVDRATGAGVNLGWPYYEGPNPQPISCPTPQPGLLAAPIYSYSDRDALDHAAVIGGGVYLGSNCVNCNFPAAYEGDYFFSDFYVGFLRRLKFAGGVWTLASPVAGQPSATDWGRGFESVSDYAIGPDGALWYCFGGTGGSDGEIRRIVYSPTPPAAVHDREGDGVVFSAPFPSPSRGSVRFAYTLPSEARIELGLYDSGGRLVRRLVPATVQSAGRYTPTWDGRSERGSHVPAGIYVARLLVDGIAHDRRVPVLR